MASYSELLDKMPKMIYAAQGLTAAVRVGTVSDGDTAVVADATVTLVADL